MNLCAMTGTSECGDRGTCLFDNRGSGMAAYCTVACDPAAAKACPSGFTCRAENCDGLNVCVRNSLAQTVNPEAGFWVGEEELLGGFSNYSLYAQAANAAGDRLFINSASMVYVRQANGKWTELTAGHPDLKSTYPTKIAVVGNTFYALYPRAYQGTFQDRRRVYKIENGVVTVVPMPNDLGGSVLCTGERQPGCYGEVVQLWQDRAGAMHVIVEGGGNDALHFKQVAGSWQRLPRETYKFALNRAYQAADGSFYTDTDPVLVSDDFVKWTELPNPTMAGGAGYQIHGFARNDLWMRIASSGVVAHWNGSKWIQENAFKGQYIDYVLKLGENQYAVGGVYSAYLYQKDCWRKVPSLNETAYPAGPGRGGVVFNGKVQIYDLGFVPEY